MKKSKRFELIWKFMKPYRLTFFTLFICIIVTSFIGMLYPYIFGLLIDEVFYHKNMDFFKVIVISYCILYLGEQLLHLVLNYVAAYFATRFNFDIRVKLYEKILSLKASYLSNIHTGDLITIINKDSDQVYELIHWNVFYLMANIMRLILCIAFVAFINLKLMLLMLLVVPISVYVSRYFAKIVRSKVKLYRDSYGKYISWVFEIVNGMREVQLFAVETHITKKFVKECSKLIRLGIKSDLVEFGSARSTDFITLLSDLSIYAVATFLILKGQLTVGTFVASIEYFSRANGILKGLNDTNIKIQSKLVSIDKVVKLMNEDSEEDSFNTKVPKKNLTLSQGQIKFSKVAFGYENGEEVLKDISFSINKGERISLVGKSGSGKSTLVNLLLRFYEPTKGHIEIDGQEIQQVSLKSLRRNIGIVQQENLLFDGTISYNIKLGNPNASQEQVWEACAKASISEFIKGLPQGLDTVLGKGGVNLSGGQKQRISIARILLKNPPILVFDEATSALDYEAEKVIQESGKTLSSGRTTIIIAHRLSTILDSDKIAVLKDGEIIAFDHHLKLLENCEYYRALFKEQYVRQEGEAV